MKTLVGAAEPPEEPPQPAPYVGTNSTGGNVVYTTILASTTFTHLSWDLRLV